MSFAPRRAGRLEIAGAHIRAGETRDLFLKVSETYTGTPVEIPLRVVRGKRPGPTVFVTAAVHGDELSGAGIVRRLMFDRLELKAGSLILIPVVNIFGLERHTRYLPDRRDLNRSFPGSPDGSLASRIAHTLFREVVLKCNFGIDLHSAAAGRTNFPHVRANLRVAELEPLARAFGCELIVHARGEPSTLRCAATQAGCPTLLLEAGEALKIEPAVVDIGARGVKNVLKHLGMLDGEILTPDYQTTVQRSRWVRSPSGGLIRFHVGPGDVLDEGALLATVDNFFTQESSSVRAPFSGIVLGMPTLPAVKPGDPVCHLAIPTRSLADIRHDIEHAGDSLHRRVQMSQAHSVGRRPRKRRRKLSSPAPAKP